MGGPLSAAGEATLCATAVKMQPEIANGEKNDYKTAEQKRLSSIYLCFLYLVHVQIPWLLWHATYLCEYVCVCVCAILERNILLLCMCWQHPCCLLLPFVPAQAHTHTHTYIHIYCTVIQTYPA